MYMTNAQIAKAAFDHLKDMGVYNLSDKQVWRIGYIYADVIKGYHGSVTWSEFKGLHFECLSEAVERFELDREAWLASRN